MRFSVIVPVHNARNTLAECLAGLERSSRPPDEVIVVDDSSTDGSAEVARVHRAILVSGKQGPRGAAWARNRGAERATGDILVYVDADVVVHPDALMRMSSVFEAEPSLHALFGSYDAHPRCSDIPSRFKNLLHHYVHQHGKRAAGSFWSGCGAIKRSALATVGGVDERYERPSVEDIELGMRLVRAGMTIRLCPEIQATHLKRWTLWNLWRTDIFARAVPWTRLVLRDAHLPNDLNLGWRSRASAAFSWAALILAASTPFVALGSLANMTYAGTVTALLLSTALNADLYRFFMRCGGVRFAAGAWLLHQAYLLYGTAQPNEQKTPVFEKLRGFPLEGVTHELEDPADHEKPSGQQPKRRYQERHDGHHDRARNDRDAQRMAEAVGGVLVALSVLPEPVIPAAIAHECHPLASSCCTSLLHGQHGASNAHSKARGTGGSA